MEYNLDDLEELEPDLAKSLRFIQKNPITDDLGISFTYENDVLGTKKTYELVPGGYEKLINEENKQEYIDLILKAKLHYEIEAQGNAFKAGLFEIVPKYLIHHLLPYEFEMLVCGQSEIELEDLKQSVQYKNCSSSDPLIQWFWEIVDKFSQSEKIGLLIFITGSASIPYRGIREFKITIIKTDRTLEYLPIAHTW